MLRDVFIILFLVFKSPVAGVTKMSKLWLSLFVLLYNGKSSSQQIKCVCYGYERKSNHYLPAIVLSSTTMMIGAKLLTCEHGGELV